MFQEGSIRFTRKVDTIYVICLERPPQELTIKSMASGSPLCPEQIVDVKMLGLQEKLEWNRDNDGLKIKRPASEPRPYAYTFAVKLQQAK